MAFHARCLQRVLGFGWVLFVLKISNNFKKVVDKRGNIVYNIDNKTKEMLKMILKFAIQTVFEILLVVGIIYGFIKEDKLIALEDKLAEKFKKR